MEVVARIGRGDDARDAEEARQADRLDVGVEVEQLAEAEDPQRRRCASANQIPPSAMIVDANAIAGIATRIRARQLGAAVARLARPARFAGAAARARDARAGRPPRDAISGRRSAAGAR